MFGLVAQRVQTKIEVTDGANLDEVERRIKEDDLSIVEDLTVGHGFTSSFDAKRACALLETLRARCGEMKKLGRVYHNGGNSLELLDAAASVASLCPAIRLVAWTLGKLTLTEKVVEACCNPTVQKVVIFGVDYNRTLMQSLCNGLCSRQDPLHELVLQFGTLDRDAIAIFANALPRMKLQTLTLTLDCGSTPYVQEDYQNIFHSLGKCATMREVCLGVDLSPRIGGLPSSRGSMHLGELVFSSILNDIERMASLQILEIFGPVNFPKAQWFQLGKTIGKCPRMTRFSANRAADQAEADAFLAGCGPHPKLVEVEIGMFLNVSSRVRRWHTRRAQCLTVLLIGSSVERVGKRCTLWKVPADIFRRLHSFLIEDES